MSPSWMRVWACILLLVFPASMMASDAVGFLNSSGEVWVDGGPSDSHSVVFAGENVRTGADARAVLTTQGMSISFGPNSDARVAPGSVEIASGTIVVAGSKADLRVNGTRITTQGALGRFLVERDNNNLKIVALAGNLMVGEGQDQTPVPATKGVNVGAQGKDKDKGPSTGTKPSWLTNPNIGILIVVAAGIAAGVALGIVNAENSKSASPAVP